VNELVRLVDNFQVVSVRLLGQPNSTFSIQVEIVAPSLIWEDLSCYGLHLRDFNLVSNKPKIPMLFLCMKILISSCLFGQF